MYNGFQHVLNGNLKSFEGFTIQSLKNMDETRLRATSSSHGLCQIMGYNALALGHTIEDLDIPAKHYPIAAMLMAKFIQNWQLDSTKDFKEMSHCWNGGHPTAITTPPNYAELCVLRKDIWEALQCLYGFGK